MESFIFGSQLWVVERRWGFTGKLSERLKSKYSPDSYFDSCNYFAVWATIPAANLTPVMYWQDEDGTCYHVALHVGQALHHVSKYLQYGEFRGVGSAVLRLLM